MTKTPLYSGQFRSAVMASMANDIQPTTVATAQKNNMLQIRPGAHYRRKDIISAALAKLVSLNYQSQILSQFLYEVVDSD